MNITDICTRNEQESWDKMVEDFVKWAVLAFEFPAFSVDVMSSDEKKCCQICLFLFFTPKSPSKSATNTS